MLVLVLMLVLMLSLVLLRCRVIFNTAGRHIKRMKTSSRMTLLHAEIIKLFLTFRSKSGTIRHVCIDVFLAKILRFRNETAHAAHITKNEVPLRGKRLANGRGSQR